MAGIYSRSIASSQMISLKVAVLILVMFFSESVGAMYYAAPLSIADWEINRTNSSCQLVHNIPSYGIADFSHYSGDQLRFSIRKKNLKIEATKASLTIKVPSWKHQSIPLKDYIVNLDHDENNLNQPRLSVFGETAENMLGALSQGLSPTFIYNESDHSLETRVAVSSVNFAKKYRQFSDCRKNFFPFGFKALLEKNIFFKTASKALTPDVSMQLQNTAKYIKEIAGTQIVIISETEIAGRADKLWFSKRANMLVSKLKKLGIAKNKITIKRRLDDLVANNKVVQLKVFGPDALKTIHYRKGNTRLTRTEKKRLEVLIQYAQEFLPDSKLIIRSHTDSKGSRSSNLKISRRRGNVVKDYLVSKGMEKSKVLVKAYGESKPVRINRFETGRSANRRVNMDFTS